MYVLAIASLVYAYMLDPATACILCILSVLLYLSSIIIENLLGQSRKQAARILTAVTIILCIASLLAFKFISRLGLGQSFPEDSLLAGFVIPLGFSYYIFQAVSYVSDVYSGTITAERNPVRLLLYLSYFAKLSSGPIERNASIRSQISNLQTVKLFESERWVYSISYIISGCFMKLIIADRLSSKVDKLLESPREYGSLYLLLGIVAISIQIYADFAGYSYLVMGISNLFGIRLSRNFNVPYLSQNINEFWRRWHMSLSSFLRDYLYIPLGGNRKGDLRRIINTIIVFTVCGLWHGLSFGFLFWGILHGLYSAFDIIFRQKGFTRIRSGLPGRIFTFLQVSAAWIFFRADSLRKGALYLFCSISNIFRSPVFGYAGEPLKSINFLVAPLIIALIAMIVADILMYRKQCDIPELFSGMPYALRYLVFSIMFISIVIYGVYGPDTSKELLYAQF